MRIRWNETEEFEVIDQYDEELDNIVECHNEIFKKGDVDEVDIIDHNKDANDTPDYVNIQFGNGSIITSLHRSAFTVLENDNKDRTSTPEDCEKCDEDDCDVSHCIISGPHEDKFPPKRINVDTINTAADYAALTQKQQVSFLIEKHSLSEKEAWEYRTNDIYGLPTPIAENFDDYDERIKEYLHGKT